MEAANAAAKLSALPPVPSRGVGSDSEEEVCRSVADAAPSEEIQRILGRLGMDEAGSG